MYSTKMHIQKDFALSPGLFSKTIEMISKIFKSVSTIDHVKIMSLCL